jgi:hypothetical protein
MGPANRNILNHGTGKGDKNRTRNIKAFTENFAGIDFGMEFPSDVDCEVLVNTKGRYVKRYGAAAYNKDGPALPKIIVH